MSAARGRTIVVSVALLALTGIGAAADPRSAAPASPISVVFVDPQRYTDARDSAPATARGSQRILDELGRFMREVGERLVPPGHSLQVRVLDIDLAGEFEPWRGPQLARVRIFREAYSPRIDLEVTRRDGEGRVLHEGRRSLRDLTYLARPRRLGDDPLRYDKDLLREWLHDELSP